MTTTLYESRSDGLKTKIRLIKAGLGSSGYYSPEVLERDGAAAFPAGTHLFFNHITESETWDRSGSRDVKDLIGKTVTDAVYNAEDESLYAEALFYNANAEFISAVHEDVDLSIEASGKRNEESGEITELLPSPHNAVALVPRGGREGKITEILESLTPTNKPLKESGKIEGIETPNPEKEKTQMTPEEITALAEAIATSLSPKFEALHEAFAPKATEDAPKIAEVVEALIASDIPENLRTRVYESANPLAEIETIKTIRESFEVKTEDAPVGRVQESGSSTGSFLTTGWGTK